MSRLRKNILAGLIILALMIFAVRLVFVQLIDGPALAKQAQEQRSRTTVIKAQRGDIVDMSGKPLATSVRRYNIGVNQVKINTYFEPVMTQRDGKEVPELDEFRRPKVKAFGPVAAAEKLAPLLKQDPAELGGKLVATPGQKPSTFVYIAKEVTPEVWRDIQKLRIPGIEPEEITKRIYPNGNIAGNIVGFTNVDGQGLAGLELSQNAKLAGVDGEESREIGRKGQEIPVESNYKKAAISGQSVKTTISVDLQNTCQQVVEQTRGKTGAQSVLAEVEEVGTGRILALCETDTVDPRDPTKSNEKNRGAKAVSTVYEPGSTMKVQTMASVLEEGKVEPVTHFTVPYKITMSNGQSFQDSVPHGVQNLTAAGIIAKSSNVGIIQVGDLVKDSQRYAKLRQVGFGKVTGIELPGESAGILPPPEKWDGRQRYTIMFGQGLAATIVQVTNGMATVANGGVKVAPHLVDSWRTPEGKTIKKKVDAGTRVYTKETARKMLTMMQGVVSKEGGAPAAAIEGYPVAGKTGTTQIINSRGQEVGTVGSFSGVFPADNPRVVVTVVVNRPKTSIYGVVVAVPAFKDIASATIRELGIPPTHSKFELYPIGG